VGKSSLKNLLHFHLLGQAIKRLSSQSLGIYLQENCPWESALIYLWKKNSNGKLIGVPHSTIFFWDLRYFHDPRLLSGSVGAEIPLPDRIAVNGLGALKEMVKGGYTEDQLMEVEALRYLYLNDAQSNPSVTVSNQIKMLVLCDYTITRTLNQLDILFDAIKRLNFGIEAIIKPHPNCPIDSKRDIPKCCQIRYDPVSELLKTCNMAYSTDATSASVEAYIKGLPIISVLSPSGFNLSPLRKFSDVVFVRNGLELSQALFNLNDIGIAKHEFSRHNYFNLDEDLPKWKNIFISEGLK
jgi:surface carbohydrate biosynthesis protein (TIGR04326 family)